GSPSALSGTIWAASNNSACRNRYMAHSAVSGNNALSKHLLVNALAHQRRSVVAADRSLRVLGGRPSQASTHRHLCHKLAALPACPGQRTSYAWSRSILGMDSSSLVKASWRPWSWALLLLLGMAILIAWQARRPVPKVMILPFQEPTHGRLRVLVDQGLS